MKVAVVYGGTSLEREVSIKTGKGIIENLDKNKYEVIDFRIDKEEDILKLKDMDIDFVYIALHGTFGEDGKVQAILEILNIPYSGSGVLSSALCIDKDLTKVVVNNAGVRTIPGKLLNKGEIITFDKLNLGNKVILKPNDSGSSIGIYFASSDEELQRGIKEIFKISDRILIEKFIEGDEISVPIIGGKVFPVLKIEPLKDTFFDYKSKYELGGAREFVFEFEKEIQEEINKFTTLAYKALKCKGFARIDYLIENGKIYFIEANTLPGMTITSLLPKSTLSKGYSYSETLDLLIKESINEKNI